MHLLILGANSDIALAIARLFAQVESATLYLASRNMERLTRKAKDLEIRYQIRAVPLYFDATDYASHQEFYGTLDPKPDGVILAFGYLGLQERAQHDFQEAKSLVETNYLGAVSILEIIASDFEKRGFGFIIGISSVAGVRGKQSNYIYGSAKGALTVYLGGLRNRLFKHNVHVLTVLPGFVRTRMTEGLELPGMLTAEPEDVAKDVYKAYKKGKDIIYSKWFWRFIIRITTAIPETIFKRTFR